MPDADPRLGFFQVKHRGRFDVQTSMSNKKEYVFDIDPDGIARSITHDGVVVYGGDIAEILPMSDIAEACNPCKLLRAMIKRRGIRELLDGLLETMPMSDILHGLNDLDVEGEMYKYLAQTYIQTRRESWD